MFLYWRGVTGLYYARRKKSSPPVVFRDTTLEGLHRQIQEYLVTGVPPWGS